MQHPMHLKHDLTLYSRPQYRSWSSWCNVCKGSADYCKRFIYQCISCEFDVCLRCTSSQERNFHHPGHEHHSLSLMPQQFLFHCDACGTEAKDSSYVCNNCTFWIHQSCASAPSTTLHSYHNHKLALAYSIPEQYYTFLNYCSICNKRMNRSNLLYYCVDCKYFAHIKCAIPTKTEALMMLRYNENESVEAEESNLLYLPLPDEPSMDAIVHQFIKKISLTDETATAPDHINHWAHADHPLVLFEEFFKTSNTSHMINGNDDQMLCDICVRPISTDLFYGCIQCKFFLHRLCTELPTELQHSSHPEHVLVSCKYNKPHSYIKCSECACICNGMFFCCKRCEFYLDVRCASLSREIVHEAHKHRLSQLKVSATVCKGCEKSIFGICYGCKACKFHLHKGCALFPSTVQHRWDDHSIPLVHPPVKNHPGLFYCEICEEEINTNYWLYFCRSCDQSFHTTCLYPYYGYSNIKFGATMKVKSHEQHSLTFVGMKKHKLPGSCRSCGDNILDGFPVFECEPCYFCLCTKCATSSTSYIIESPLLLRSSENENDKADDASDFDEPNLVHFPLPDKRSQGTTIEQIVKAISLVDETTIAADHIYYHWTQGDHLLILFNEAHKHRLRLLEVSGSVCRGCGESFSGMSFGCEICNFDIDISCAVLPGKVSHRSDQHPVRLIYSCIKDYQHSSCEICGGKINPNCWLYFCQDCDKSFHPSCLYPYYGFTKTKIGETKYNRSHRPKSIYFFRHEAVDDLMRFPLDLDDKWSLALLIQKFIKASLKEDTIEVADHRSGHWTHKDHELTLFDQLEQNNRRQTTNDEMICDACVECLSADPYYGYLQCNFFLHRFCAELPEELQHPLHPKHKLLRAQYTKPYHYFECDVCQERCNGVFYYCVSCNFYVDIKCASLPNTIKHQSHHQHPLRLLRDFFNKICHGCRNPFSGMSFGCEICYLYMHIRCVLLPGQVRHRSDHHPVFLIFRPFENHPDPFFCEICEEEINRSIWLYYCRDCKRWFHPSCLRPPHGFSNIKFGARNIKVYHHPHNLTFVSRREHEGRLNSICERCGDEIPHDFPYLECKPCNIVFCMKCGDRKLLKNIN